MSRAVELAKKYIYGKKFALDGRVTEYSFFPDNLEAFYHAARVEALREAVESCRQVGQQPSSLWQEPGCWTHSAEACAVGLRAMAEREGK